MSWTHIEDVRIAKTRKRKVCELCGKWIAIGSPRVSRFGYADGGATRFDMHVECEEVSQSWDLTDWETHTVGDGDWPERDDEGNLVTEVGNE